MSLFAESEQNETALAGKVAIAQGALRRFDATPPEGYETNRTATRYLSSLGGIEKLLCYIDLLSTDPLLLDVGAGTTRGIRELALISHKLGYNTRFAATVLDGTNILGFPGLSEIPIKQTPVEELEGIEDGSVSAVIGVYSIQYSAEPALAAAQIDRVLKPGGVIKTAYKIGAQKNSFGNFQHDFKEMADALWKRGFDTKYSLDFDQEAHTGDCIILGVKPAGELIQDAGTLLDLDRSTLYPTQMGNFVEALRS